MGSSKKKRDKESDRKKYKKEKRDRDGKSRDKSKKRREDDDELLDYALHDAVEVQQNVYDYGHGLSKGMCLLLTLAKDILVFYVDISMVTH